MPTVEAVLAVMLSLPQYRGDVLVDPPADRARLYRPTAQAIADVSRNATEAAALIALGYHETAFARYVLQGFCEQGPAGARCDGGRARGPWQVWSWCRGAWDGPDGTERAVREGARCAVGLLRTARVRCQAQGWAGMFSGYRALSNCTWPGGHRRVSTMALVQGRLGATVREPGSPRAVASRSQ